ncbi:MAG: NADH:flavin oxidoreductase/NADH oxidase family protein [Pseudomonadota bacterium]
MTPHLFTPLQLPNGAIIKNRLAKAAMEENLADDRQAPGQLLQQLYRAWNQGGAGLLLTGNVMVDGTALTGPGGVVLEDETRFEQFRQWAAIGREQSCQFWMQINHPGRQTYASMKQEAKGPSAIAVNIAGLERMFAVPKAMTADDIADVQARFCRTAVLAEKAGFSGVQIHAAHGYLLSQFLSPLTNTRTDQWGGSLENRARLLLDIVKAVRAATAPGFCVAVKLNSADFQRGGFDHADALQVVTWLNELSVDLLEVSGGSYESPAMQGQTSDERSLAREAYFLDFAGEVRAIARMPVMVTGGIRRREVAEEVLASGVDMVGIATALVFAPDLPKRWQAGHHDVPAVRVAWRKKALAAAAVMAIIKTQLARLAKGEQPRLRTQPLLALIRTQWRMARRTRVYWRWLAQRSLDSSRL